MDAEQVEVLKSFLYFSCFFSSPDCLFQMSLSDVLFYYMIEDDFHSNKTVLNIIIPFVQLAYILTY